MVRFLCLFAVILCFSDAAISPHARPRIIGPDGFEPYAESPDRPNVFIVRPKNAELIVGDEADEPVVVKYNVTNFELGEGIGKIDIYLLANTVQSGLHIFESIPFTTPYKTLYSIEREEEDGTLSFELADLPYGLHYLLIRLVKLPQEEVVTETARYFELRYTDEYDERETVMPRSVLDASFDVDNEGRWEAEEDVEDFLARYVQLHHAMISKNNDKNEKSGVKFDKPRFVIVDAMMGGLGNRLGSIISGALLAVITDRALLVASDLPRYFEQGRPESGGIAWNYASMEQVRSVVAQSGADSDELRYDDMWDLTEMLTCFDISHQLADRTSFVIQTPHYFAPFLFANPYYRQRLYSLMGDDAAGIMHRFLFRLIPKLEVKVNEFRAAVGTRHLIALQIRQDHSCDNMTLTNDRGERVRTKAFMTYEHERLWFTCAQSISRGIPGNPSSVAYFVASDLPDEMIDVAKRHFGAENLVYSPLATNPELERDAMSSRAGVEFAGAVIDMWLLGEAKDIITTPASSFGWMGAARSSLHPLYVTKWGKCLRATTSQPFCHGMRLLEKTSCFVPNMYVPENDMICQDCVSLECACGSLMCGSHSERRASLFPRGACRLPG